MVRRASAPAKRCAVDALALRGLAGLLRLGLLVAMGADKPLRLQAPVLLDVMPNDGGPQHVAGAIGSARQVGFAFDAMTVDPVARRRVVRQQLGVRYEDVVIA